MASQQQGQGGSLRIIGGQWRGRKLSFTAAEGLRPTSDRIRETLFNWLAPDLPDSRCLDLYAGSGALGLEALSRGAAQCVFVDNSAAAISDINQHLQTLDSDQGQTVQSPATRFLQQQPTGASAFDIAFLDPPFADGLLASSCEELERANLLATGALIYLEFAKRDGAPVVPENWRLHRDKKAGAVCYQLFVRD